MYLLVVVECVVYHGVVNEIGVFGDEKVGYVCDLLVIGF